MGIAKKLAALRCEAALLEEAAGRVADDVDRLLSELGQGDPNWSETVPAIRRPDRERPNTDLGAAQVLRKLAEAGADTVVIKRCAKGYAVVTIDRYPAVKLPPRLVHLLEVLCVDAPTDDHLVGFKPVAKLGLLLTERTGDAFTPHAIENLVSRLRTALHGARGNRLLVERRDGGYRFNKRRDTEIVIKD